MYFHKISLSWPVIPAEFSNLDKESEEKGLQLSVLKYRTWLDADFKKLEKSESKLLLKTLLIISVF